MKQNNEVFKIAITGPESTGKTTLSIELANHYKSGYVPEFARKYLLNIKNDYSQKDIFYIAERQLRREEIVESCIRKKTECNLLFSDTELINIKIWLEDKKWEVPLWIEERLLQPNYQLYLLMDIDLPWQSDSLRENPSRAQYFFEKFEEYLKWYNKPYKIIGGIGSNRKQNAIHFINSYYF